MSVNCIKYASFGKWYSFAWLPRYTVDCGWVWLVKTERLCFHVERQFMWKRNMQEGGYRGLIIYFYTAEKNNFLLWNTEIKLERMEK